MRLRSCCKVPDPNGGYDLTFYWGPVVSPAKNLIKPSALFLLISWLLLVLSLLLLLISIPSISTIITFKALNPFEGPRGTRPNYGVHVEHAVQMSCNLNSLDIGEYYRGLLRRY